MKLILTTMVLMSIAFGAQAQYVTYNHDASKMNQITVEETGTGTLKPEVYYWLLHNKYKKTASVKNKLTFRTSAGIASYQQVDIAETIDSALTSRAKIEAMNMTDRQIDLAWLAEGEKIESQMVKFQKNIDRILIAGGTPKERERWSEYYRIYQCAIKATKDAYMPNEQRKKVYLQIYADITNQNKTLVKYLVQLNNVNNTKELLSSTDLHSIDKKSIVRNAMDRWNESKYVVQSSQNGNGEYDGEESVNRQ